MDGAKNTLSSLHIWLASGIPTWEGSRPTICDYFPPLPTPTLCGVEPLCVLCFRPEANMLRHFPLY